MSREAVYELVGAALLVLLGVGFALGGASYGILNEDCLLYTSPSPRDRS